MSKTSYYGYSPHNFFSCSPWNSALTNLQQFISYYSHLFTKYAYFAFRLCCRITSLESGFDSCQPYKTVGTAGGGTFLKPVYWNVVVISSSSFKKRRGCMRDWNDGVGKLFYLAILTCWRGDAEKMTWAQFCWHEQCHEIFYPPFFSWF